MNKIAPGLIMAIALSAQIVSADVRIEMNTKNASGKLSDSSVILAKGDNIRIDNEGRSSNDTSMIFRDNQIVVLNHDEKTYMVIDEQMMKKVNTQMSDAMKKMEETLSKMPPQQREMVRKMMQSTMGKMSQTQTQDESDKIRVVKGKKSKWQTYSCTEYKIYKADVQIQEVCSASINQIDNSKEIIDAFKKMAKAMKKMTESLKSIPFVKAIDNPMSYMQDIEGFPVYSKSLRKGKMTKEVFMKSAESKNLNSSLFEAPKDYKRKKIGI